MSPRRFDGAITTADDSGEIRDASLAPAPERPRRPILIELGSAILIVGGMTAVLENVGFAVAGAEVGVAAGPLGALILALNLLTILVGVLVRLGRAWVLAINVVAIALFLELTALPSTFAIVFAGLDAIVLFALFRHRAWFDWRPDEAAAGRADGGLAR